MRIRKNQLLFPSYLSSTMPLSDPNLMNRSPVMVQLNDVVLVTTNTTTTTTTTTPHHDSSVSVQVPSNLDHYQPFDQIPPTIGETTNGYDLSGITESGPHRQHNKQQPLDEDETKQESNDSKEKGNSHFRKRVILGSEIVAHEVLSPSSFSSTQDGRWCDGEKAIPLKKRRGSFENNNGNSSSNKKMKAKMKTKMNKKCSTRNDNDNNDDDTDWVEEDKSRDRVNNNNNNSNVGNKKKAKGSAVMEGSRCSRVNGRGWRCCQQTLVGYSLCEHHLGKGRLRSMSSVRNRSSIIASTTEQDHKNNNMHYDDNISEASSIPEKKINCVSVNDDEKKTVIVTKRRMKLGMVKARSISSLLGQTKNNVVVAHEDNK